MIDRYAIDFAKTFNGAMLLAIEPKMQRADRNDAKSAMEQAKDKEGVLKWTVTVAVQVKSFESVKFDTVPITVTSPTRPYAQVAPGSPVVIEGLEMGIMAQSRGGFSVFYSATNIRSVQMGRAAAAQ